MSQADFSPITQQLSAWNVLEPACRSFWRGGFRGASGVWGGSQWLRKGDGIQQLLPSWVTHSVILSLTNGIF